MPDANGVPTTFEMDGLFTQEDIDRRFTVWKQCTRCSKWSKVDSRDKDAKCHHCGSADFDIQSTTSDRTFDPIKASKRRIVRKK